MMLSSPDLATGIVSMAVEWRSHQQAAQKANQLIELQARTTTLAYVRDLYVCNLINHNT